MCQGAGITSRTHPATEARLKEPSTITGREGSPQAWTKICIGMVNNVVTKGIR